MLHKKFTLLTASFLLLSSPAYLTGNAAHANTLLTNPILSPTVLVNGNLEAVHPVVAVVKGNVVFVDVESVLARVNIYNADLLDSYLEKWNNGDKVGLYKRNNGVVEGVTKEGKHFQIIVNQPYFLLDQQQIPLNAAPVLEQERVLVPLSFVQKLFEPGKYVVRYDPSQNAVAVYLDPTQQEIEAFKEEIKNYLGRNIWYRSTLIVRNEKGEIVTVPHLTAMWILKVEKDDFFKLTVKSGDNIYYVTAYDADSVKRGFLNYDPITGSNWSKEVWDHIKKQSIFVGMNEEMVWLAWGLPTRTHTTIDAQGKWEQWVYESNYSGTKYLYFRDGILVSIQAFDY